MTAQEQQMLQGLAERINSTQLPDKDPDAEQYLQMNIGNNPDALYIMAQTVLVQQYALTQAQKQLADAKAQLDQVRQQGQGQDQTRHSGSFLGNLLGLHDDSRQAPPPPPPPPQQQQYGSSYAQPQYVPVPPAAYPPQYAPAGYAPVYGAPQSGGFLRSAMQTATGVAAGALAFEGIESLMHGFGGGGFGGGGLGGGGFEGQGRPEEVINNYYGDDAGREHSSNDFRGDDSRSSGGAYETHDNDRGDLSANDGVDSYDSSNDVASNSDDGGDFGGGGGDDFNS